MTATVEAALAAARSFPISTLDERLGQGGLLVIAPHPDDESLGCGGLIAEACRSGRPVRVVIVSDGTGSHPGSRAYPAQRLKQLREEEAREAARELGLDPRDVVFLGLPDRFVPSEGPAAEAAVASIADCARAVKAGALFVTWRHDPHCDHQASYRLARAVQSQIANVRLYEYTVWGSALPHGSRIESATCGFRLRMKAHMARKRRAVAAHRSQISGLIDDDPEGFRLTISDRARFDLPWEAFFESDA